MTKELGKTMCLVIFAPRGLERVDEAARHNQHREATSHDQSNSNRLAFHPVQVAQKFTVKVRDALPL